MRMIVQVISLKSKFTGSTFLNVVSLPVFYVPYEFEGIVLCWLDKKKQFQYVNLDFMKLWFYRPNWTIKLNHCQIN